MKERQILFSSKMVRAILEDRKTMTRRIIKNVPSGDHFGKDIMDWTLSGIHQDGKLEGTEFWYLDVQCAVDDHTREIIRCPYGKPGDRLWVREAIRHAGDGVSFYSADNSITVADAWPWKRNFLPPMHCPRGLSRILLEIVSVRVERLQDISDSDAISEGITLGGPIGHLPNYQAAPYTYHFAQLWESINGAGSWSVNPWVWVIEFKRI